MAQVARRPLPLQLPRDFISPPGDTLSELLEENRMSQLEAASRCGVSVKHLNEVITAAAPLSARLALALEQVFQVPASLWMSLEANYRADLAKAQRSLSLDDAKAWVNHFNYSALAKLGFLPEENGRTPEAFQRKAQALLDFFRLNSPSEWERIWLNPKVAFRRSLKGLSKPYDTSAWLRAGEREAERLVVEAFDRAAFQEVFQQVKQAARRSDIGAAVEELQVAFAKTGVALVVLPAPPGIGVSGATHWRHSDLAILQLSLRYKTDDSFFFTLAHEAAHILLHGKHDVFLEGAQDNDADKESEANRWASNFWIPTKTRQAFERRGEWGYEAIERFADELGIPPGLVVGQLQHSGHLPHTHLNGMKRKLAWASPD